LNLIYMFNSGAVSDTASLMSWITWWVAAHPEWLRRLRESDAPDAMAERIVRETLRLSQSEYLVRRTTAPITVGGFAVPAGWLVRVCVREIHRRDDAFPDAGLFRPDRFLNPPDASRYAPFGASRVGCLGEGMTLMFGRALLLSMADRYEIRVIADGPPDLGPFHWRPSERFRIGLDNRQQPAPGVSAGGAWLR
jgi:cytochrome P450